MARKKDNNPLVRYDNKLNMITLRDMSQIENNVFFALLYKLKDQGTNEVRLDFVELKKLIGFEGQNNEHIVKSVAEIAEKIAKSVVRHETDESIRFFTLFQILEVPKTEQVYIRAKISEPFAYMINNLKQGFTAFELAEFSSLSSKYTQVIYRLLKQFRSSGLLSLEWSEFVRILDIPKTYQISDIDKQILKPAVKELSDPAKTLFRENAPIFKELFYKKIRGSGKGRPVEKIEFYFYPETKDQKTKDQAKANLTTIANDIQREQELRKLKKAAPKTHPITGKEIDETQEYLGRYLRIHNDKLGLTDMLKIEKIEKSGEQLEVFLRNVDDGFRSSMRFDNFRHFKNTFERYGD